MAVPLAQQAFAFVSYEERLEMANVYEQLQAKKLAAVVRKMRKANITIEILKGDVFTKKGEQYLESLNHTFAPQFEIEFSFNREPTEKDRAEDVDAFMRCIPGFLSSTKVPARSTAAHSSDTIRRHVTPIEKITTGISGMFAGKRMTSMCLSRSLLRRWRAESV
jgi:hypothetical protein